jgi:hypothetical protein
MRWGDDRLWERFDAFLDKRFRDQLEAMSSTKTPSRKLTSADFMAAISALEARERALGPEYN